MNIPNGTPLLPKLNLLVSYAYLRGEKEKDRKFEDLMLAMAPYINLLIDSGAFTNYTSTLKAAQSGTKYVPFTLEEYMAVCQARYHGRVWEYIQLDVIGNSENSWRNLNTMYDAGLTPMPVFVESYDYDMVPKVIAFRERICVAGGVMTGDNYVYQRYQKVYKYSEGRAKIHGLGFLRWPDVFQLPIATGDSSSMSSGARFGTISFYSRKNGYNRVGWKKIVENPQKYADHIGMLRNCGISIEQFSSKASYFKSTSIPTFSDVYTSILYHQHAVDMNFGMIIALSSPIWVHMLTATIATLHPKGFDYNETVKIYMGLREWWKTNPQKVIDFTLSTFISHTDQINRLGPDQPPPLVVQKQQQKALKDKETA